MGFMADSPMIRLAKLPRFSLATSLAALTAAALMLIPTPSIAQQPPPSFVDASTVVPNLVVEMRYLTAHNFVGAPIAVSYTHLRAHETDS